MRDNLGECFKYIDFGRITRTDINRDRPHDQCNISTERVIRHGLIVLRRVRWFKPYWAVCSLTVYEMAGTHRNQRYMGGRCWAETDLTGREWWFKTEEQAYAFVAQAREEMK